MTDVSNSSSVDSPSLSRALTFAGTRKSVNAADGSASPASTSCTCVDWRCRSSKYEHSGLAKSSWQVVCSDQALKSTASMTQKIVKYLHELRNDIANGHCLTIGQIVRFVTHFARQNSCRLSTSTWHKIAHSKVRRLTNALTLIEGAHSKSERARTRSPNCC